MTEPRIPPGEARQLRSAGRKVETWTEERDRLIRRHIEAGATLREVAGLVGLSHTAVRFIARGRGPAA